MDPLLTSFLEQLPAVSITGPRATGKTTTARRRAATVVRLDRAGDAGAFRADPDVALRGLTEPVLLDEWQEVPGVLGAVKRAVDDDPRSGRYILTGSVRIDLDLQTWPGTGRLVRLPMQGLSEREISGETGGALFLERLLAANLDALGPGPPADLGDYLDLALRGGFPEPSLQLTGLARQAWLDSYLEQLITRDAPAVAGSRDPDRLRRYVEAVAVNTAGVVEDKTLYEAAGIDRRTAVAYEQLLRNLLFLEALPGWQSNRLPRLTGMRKRYLLDPSIIAAALRVDSTTVLRDANLLGRVIDTFVASQIRPELAVAPSRPRWYHLRDKGGRHEVDLVIECGGGKVAGIEVKAGAAPTRRDARHLDGCTASWATVSSVASSCTPVRGPSSWRTASLPRRSARSGPEVTRPRASRAVRHVVVAAPGSTTVGLGRCPQTRRQPHDESRSRAAIDRGRETTRGCKTPRTVSSMLLWRSRPPLLYW